MFWYLGQQMLEILVDIKIISLSGLYDAVQNSTGFSSVNGIDELPVFLPNTNGLIACSARLLSSGICGSVRNTLKYFS